MKEPKKCGHHTEYFTGSDGIRSKVWCEACRPTESVEEGWEEWKAQIAKEFFKARISDMTKSEVINFFFKKFDALLQERSKDGVGEETMRQTLINDFVVAAKVFPDLTPLETLNMVLVKDEREALIKEIKSK